MHGRTSANGVRRDGGSAKTRRDASRRSGKAAHLDLRTGSPWQLGQRGHSLMGLPWLLLTTCLRPLLRRRRDCASGLLLERGRRRRRRGRGRRKARAGQRGRGDIKTAPGGAVLLWAALESPARDPSVGVPLRAPWHDSHDQQRSLRSSSSVLHAAAVRSKHHLHQLTQRRPPRDHSGKRLAFSGRVFASAGSTPADGPSPIAAG
ncbi:hypothetical protein FKP32DRAFT_436989 [Trametes sanguinea]|nr:hypothetical protein FKP32DRAFT_436989 [Trametes sanguinea]